jgi:hypothetical protein
MKPKYKCNDSDGVLPADLHKKAIQFARRSTGLDRPHASQKAYIESYRQCFLDMKELNMLNEEFQNGTPEKSSN